MLRPFSPAPPRRGTRSGDLHFLSDGAHDPFHCGVAEMGAEVDFDFVGIVADFFEADEGVADAVFPVVGVGRAYRAVEAVQPAEEGQSERAAAALADFFVDIAFFAAEAAEARVEAGPGGASPAALYGSACGASRLRKGCVGDMNKKRTCLPARVLDYLPRWCWFCGGVKHRRPGDCSPGLPMFDSPGF